MDKLLETQENLKKRNENLKGMLDQMKGKKVTILLVHPVELKLL